MFEIPKEFLIVSDRTVMERKKIYNISVGELNNVTTVDVIGSKGELREGKILLLEEEPNYDHLMKKFEKAFVKKTWATACYIPYHYIKAGKIQYFRVQRNGVFYQSEVSH